MREAGFKEIEVNELQDKDFNLIPASGVKVMLRIDNLNKSITQEEVSELICSFVSAMKEDVWLNITQTAFNEMLIRSAAGEQAYIAQRTISTCYSKWSGNFISNAIYLSPTGKVALNDWFGLGGRFISGVGETSLEIT